MGGGRGKGKAGESNEDATLRMISKGGYGGGNGRHGKKGPPPSTSEIPEERRAELNKKLEDFRESTETQLSMPSTISGLERKYLHEVAEKLGFTSQSFGAGKDRYLCILKPEMSVGAAEESLAAADDTAKGSDDDGNDWTEVKDKSKRNVVHYSACVLSASSKARLAEYFQKALGGFPSDCKVYCDHMTVCLGPRSKPRTEDNRSVADVVKGQIGKYKEMQEFELKVVSVGELEDKVWAVGVVGCVSCNKNPHITVATHPEVAPSLSNSIRQWRMLPVEQQLTVYGLILERGQDDKTSRVPAATAQELSCAKKASAD
eukprot:TRINITY_DN19725_c0_g1_i1.p1 TRINITY_DN19725_c0_g1~~TRINITY_DN19725_c0_g1_i1.p1  ORF type:complete len:317 (+),score=87.91 TRINITY_DN19725_c0_g1_i1:56-1006(+)